MAAAVGVPVLARGGIAAHADAGEILVRGIDARVDHADLDAGAIGAHRPGLRRLHVVDPVRRDLAQRIARCVQFDVLDVRIVAQALQRGGRHGDGEDALAIQLQVDLAAGGLEGGGDVRLGAGLVLDHDPVRVRLGGESAGGQGEDEGGAKGGRELAASDHGFPGNEVVKSAAPHASCQVRRATLPRFPGTGCCAATCRRGAPAGPQRM